MTDCPLLIAAAIAGLILALICAAANWPRAQQMSYLLRDKPKASNDAARER